MTPDPAPPPHRAPAPRSPLRPRPLGEGRTAGPAPTQGPFLDRRRRPGRDRPGRIDRERRVPPRARRVRPVRSGAALGDAGRGLPADRFQHGTDALDNGHGGTRRDGVHAHGSVGAVLGVVLRAALLPAGRVARLGGCGRGRDLLPHLPRSRGSGARHAGLPDRRRHLRRVRGDPAVRQADRAHPGASQLGAGGGDPGRFPDSGRDLRVARHVGVRGRGADRLRPRGRVVPLHSRRGGLAPDRGVRRVLGGGRRDQPHALQLGARQGLWNGWKGRIHPGRGRR